MSNVGYSLEQRISETENRISENDILRKGIQLPKDELIFLFKSKKPESKKPEYIVIAYGFFIYANNTNKLNDDAELQLPYLKINPPDGPGFNLSTVEVFNETKMDEYFIHSFNRRTDKILLYKKDNPIEAKENLRDALFSIGYTNHLDEIINKISLRVPE